MLIHKTEKVFPDCGDEASRCPACSDVFKVGTGVVYEGGYTKAGVDKYGYVVFCSLKCIVEIMEVEGHA